MGYTQYAAFTAETTRIVSHTCNDPFQYEILALYRSRSNFLFLLNKTAFCGFEHERVHEWMRVRSKLFLAPVYCGLSNLVVLRTFVWIGLLDGCPEHRR